MKVRPSAAIAFSLALVSCAHPTPPSAAALSEVSAPLAYARLGEIVVVDGPKVTPLAVLEDSRCPMNARCVWAGQVRLRVKVHLGSRDEVLELISNTPVHVADGSLELVSVEPDRVAGGDNGGSIDDSDYGFGFRFMGGI